MLYVEYLGLLSVPFILHFSWYFFTSQSCNFLVLFSNTRVLHVVQRNSSLMLTWNINAFERFRELVIYCSGGNFRDRHHVCASKYISMTSLLMHNVAQSTRHSFRLKTNNQPLKKFLSLAFSWVVKNWISFLKIKWFKSWSFQKMSITKSVPLN